MKKGKIINPHLWNQWIGPDTDLAYLHEDETGRSEKGLYLYSLMKQKIPHLKIDEKYLTELSQQEMEWLAEYKRFIPRWKKIIGALRKHLKNMPNRPAPEFQYADEKAPLPKIFILEEENIKDGTLKKYLEQLKHLFDEVNLFLYEEKSRCSS